MFNLEQEVPSLELCRKLKEVGYPQDGGGWYWIESYRDEWYIDIWDSVFLQIAKLQVKDYIKAPTCRELGEWIEKSSIAEEYAYYPLQINPDNLAEDLIWLAENEYVKFKEQ